jgi:hypothetical protein
MGQRCHRFDRYLDPEASGHRATRSTDRRTYRKVHRRPRQRIELSSWGHSSFGPQPLPPGVHEVQTRIIQPKVKYFHLHSAAPDRVARLRCRGPAFEFQEGRGRTRRHTDGDQPPNPIVGALLRAGSVPPEAKAPVANRGRSPPISNHSRRPRIVCHRFRLRKARWGQAAPSRDDDKRLCEPLACATPAPLEEGAPQCATRSDRHRRRPGPACRRCRRRHSLCPYLADRRYHRGIPARFVLARLQT